jgi:hypothetical protein
VIFCAPTTYLHANPLCSYATTGVSGSRATATTRAQFGDLIHPFVCFDVQKISEINFLGFVLSEVTPLPTDNQASTVTFSKIDRESSIFSGGRLMG